MSGPHIADHSVAGFVPLQDHRKGVTVGARLKPAGVRLVDAEGTDDPRLFTIDAQEGAGSAGDWPGWRWWLPDDRDCGGWSPALIARVTSSQGTNKDARGNTVTGGGVVETGVRPVRDAEYAADDAFKEGMQTLPDWLPLPAKGVVVLGAAGTREDRQEDILGWLDPRLIAANRSPQDAMGSMICDLDPEDTISESRVARLQTLGRVAHVPDLGKNIGNEEGWVAAWQHGLTGQGRQVGLGAIYGRLDRVLGSTAGSTVQTARGGATHGVALMARDAWGPIHCGHQNDKHKFETNEDGEPVNSAHLDALRHFWYLDQERDGPQEFDNLPYGPVRAPVRTATWLRWDALAVHQWNGQAVQGLWRWESESFFTQKAPRRPGDTTPPSEPGDPTPRAPTEPNDPERPRDTVIPPPGFGRPAYPGEDGAPPAAPSIPAPDWRRPQGDLRPGDPGYRRPRGAGPDGIGITARPWRPVAIVDHAALEPEAVAWAPTQLGFSGALLFPQHLGRSGADLRLSAMPPESAIAQARDTTPAVGRWESFGAQQADSWDYTQRPGYSRVPGGTADGMLLFMPPEVDGMDRGTDFAPGGVTLSEVAMGWADGAYAVWGLPGTDGKPRECAWRAKRTVSAGTVYSALNFETVDGTGTWSTALVCQKDANGVGVGVGGTAYLKLPTGTTAQRPATPANGMMRYNSTIPQVEAYFGGAWNPWGGSSTGRLVKVTVYSTSGSGTHTWDTGATSAIVVGIGGGGGGGGVAGTTAGQSACGGGGGAGGYFCHRFASFSGADASYAVGAGGAGGAAGGGNGTAGGDTTFDDAGTTFTAKGGGGGSFIAESAATGVAAGGSNVLATGSPNITAGAGNPGAPGFKLGAAVSVGGLGGCSHLGGAGGVGGINDAAGVDGIGPGAGGGGASSTSASANDYAGGAGKDGMVIVYEYA